MFYKDFLYKIDVVLNFDFPTCKEDYYQFIDACKGNNS
jgi:hypothetical protein